MSETYDPDLFRGAAEYYTRFRAPYAREAIGSVVERTTVNARHVRKHGPAQCARRVPRGTRERSGEMTLIGKARHRRDLRQRQVIRKEQACLPNPQQRLILPDAAPMDPAEYARKMHRVHAGARRQGSHTHRLGVVGVHIGDDGPQPVRPP